MPPQPKINAFLICDHVIHEAGTNKKSLIGVFHNISANSFPCTHYSMCIYVNLIDAQGTYDFELKLIDLAGGAQIGNALLPRIVISDRLKPAEICINLQGITFARHGKYEFQFYGNRELIASKDFLVEKRDVRGPDAPQAQPGLQ